VFLKRNNHWVGVAGIAIGCVFSIYFYLGSQPTGEISLLFNTVKIAQATQGIKILDSHDIPISSDVYALEIVVWNTGALSLGVKSDRIRRPLSIILGGASRILVAQVQRTLGASLAELNIQPNISDKTIMIDWTQFDPGDAFKLLIVYSAKVQSSISYEGRIVGTNFWVRSEAAELYPEHVEDYSSFFHRILHYVDRAKNTFIFDWYNSRINAVWLLLVVVMFCSFPFFVFFDYRSYRSGGQFRSLYKIIYMGMMFFVIVLQALTIFSRTAPPI
jgi:hypothetical protein